MLLIGGIGMYTYIIDEYKYAYFVVPLEIASKLSEWNNYLAEQCNAGTPVTVYYKLAEPTKIPFNSAQIAVLNKIEQLHSYKGGTHVYNTYEISPIFNVKYTKDLNAVISNISQNLVGGN